MKKKILLLILAISLISGACGSVKEDGSAAGASRTEQGTEVSLAAAAVSAAQAEETITPSPIETPEPEPAYLKERAGKYYLGEIDQAGIKMRLKDIARIEGYGIVMQLDLKKNGSGIMMVFGEEWSFTWDEHQFAFDGETVDYSWTKEDGVFFTKEGIVYHFAYQKASDIVKAEEAKKEAQAEEQKKAKEKKEAEESKSSIAYAVMTGADWVALADSDAAGLCVWYEFTNKTDEYISPYAFQAEIRQGDVVTPEGSVSLSDEEAVPEEDYRYTEVQPGGTCRSIHLFAADPDGGKIRYTVEDENGEILINEKLDPKDLPGRPEEDFVPEKIEDLSYMDSLPAKGDYNELYQLTVKKDASVVESSIGKGKMLRVPFTFTNNSAKTVSPYMVVYLRAVQDGISLNPGWSSSDDPDLQLIYEDVPPGEKAAFYYEWHLISDSPVAVEAYDWFDGKAVLGRAYDLSELE